MRLTLSLKHLHLFILVLAVCCPPVMAANDATPVVNTTILVKKTGSAPFDDIAGYRDLPGGSVGE